MLSLFNGNSKTWNIPKVQQNSKEETDGHYRLIPLDRTVESLEENSTDEERKESDAHNQKRRVAVPAQAVNADKQDFKKIEIVKYPKKNEEEKLITTAIVANEFLKNLLQGERLQEVVDAMYARKVKTKEIIIREGMEGSHMYVSASGSYEISKKGKVLNTFDDSRVFGELAILYNAKRQATIRALKDGQLWVVDRNVFQQIIVRDAIQKREELVSFLRNVPKLNTKDDETLGQVADLLRKEFFATGTQIVREGDKGDKFYIIAAGTVTITKQGQGKVATYTRGQFFGELALLKEDCRQATVTADAPGVECLTLARPQFVDYFGDIDPGSITTIKEKEIEQVQSRREHQDITLKDLNHVYTLGVGGFGRVELVQHKTRKELTFALKYLKKIDMIQQQQQEHTFNEKIIQMNCDSQFIVRLYNTFQDAKYLYFLMESCLGGDLWGLLQKQKLRRFDEPAARFYSACVLEAFAYLHDRGIIYRDLKPENLLLDSQGYLKITDFGFAKKLINKGKTYTFAGTPEYVAPEIVLARGHDKAADYWAFGVFIFELLVGKTPFKSNDSTHMKTYTNILRGIESIKFPESVPRNAQHLIKRLCKSMASERLGCQKEGAEDIRRQKWYAGFDWKKLRARQLKAPIPRNLKSNIDRQYFDKYENDTDVPPDDHSNDFQNF